MSGSRKIFTWNKTQFVDFDSLIIFAAEILVIRRTIEDNPELYLDELQVWLEYRTGEVYAIPTLQRCLRQMQLTVKKVIRLWNQPSLQGSC